MGYQKAAEVTSGSINNKITYENFTKSTTK